MQELPELELEDKEVYTEIDRCIPVEDAGLSYRGESDGTAIYDNLLFYGNGLSALELLKVQFAGKIKCICTTPPTDTYTDKSTTYLSVLRAIRERLILMSVLLSEDGTLWLISNETESPYLCAVLNEIYGEGNYLSTIRCEDSVNIVVYAKNKNKCGVKIPENFDSPHKQIISLATNDGDIVLDPYFVDGMTAVTAHESHIRWIGLASADIGQTDAIPRLNAVIDVVGGGYRCFRLEPLKLTKNFVNEWVLDRGQGGARKLHDAKQVKDDEFYTQYDAVEKEMEVYVQHNPDIFRNKTVLLPCDDPDWSNFTKYFLDNFERFGLKKLISTCIAHKPQTQGKLMIRTMENIHEPPQWRYLQGNGDFRGEETSALRDISDFIITNPPFSLFRDFVTWLVKTDIQYSIIGDHNAIGYLNVFPLFLAKKMWLGVSEGRTYYTRPDKTVQEAGCTCWFTNIDHGVKRSFIPLKTMEENIKTSKHQQIRELGYLRYDNYDALDIPFTDAIPSDYDGIMGVPISFMHKYSPEQFELIGATGERSMAWLKTKIYTLEECRQAHFVKFGKKGCYGMNSSAVIYKDGFWDICYKRIFIRRIK